MSWTFLSVSTQILSGLSTSCSLTCNLAASELNMSHEYKFWSHKAMISDPCTWCTHLILSAFLWSFVLWCKYHLEEAPFAHILHQSFLFYLDCFELRVWSLWLGVYIWIVVCYDFGCPSCWGALGFVSGSSMCPCYGLGVRCPLTSIAILALGRKQLSINDMSCYHHCSNYSSGRELQCGLMIIKSFFNYSVGQSLVFIWHDDFVSVVGMLVALLGKRPLVWSFTFHALWSLEHCIPLSLGLIN